MQEDRWHDHESTEVGKELTPQPSPSPSPTSSREKSIPSDCSREAISNTNDANIPLEDRFPFLREHTARRRSRQLLTAEQTSVLLKILERTKFPSTAVREAAARDLGITPRKVQVFFQNKRQGLRKKMLNAAQDLVDLHHSGRPDMPRTGHPFIHHGPDHHLQYHRRAFSLTPGESMEGFASPNRRPHVPHSAISAPSIVGMHPVVSSSPPQSPSLEELSPEVARAMEAAGPYGRSSRVLQPSHWDALHHSHLSPRRTSVDSISPKWSSHARDYFSEFERYYDHHTVSVSGDSRKAHYTPREYSRSLENSTEHEMQMRRSHSAYDHRYEHLQHVARWAEHVPAGQRRRESTPSMHTGSRMSPKYRTALFGGTPASSSPNQSAAGSPLGPTSILHICQDGERLRMLPKLSPIFSHDLLYQQNPAAPMNADSASIDQIPKAPRGQPAINTSHFGASGIDRQLKRLPSLPSFASRRSWSGSRGEDVLQAPKLQRAYTDTDTSQQTLAPIQERPSVSPAGQSLPTLSSSGGLRNRIGTGSTRHISSSFPGYRKEHDQQFGPKEQETSTSTSTYETTCESNEDWSMVDSTWDVSSSLVPKNHESFGAMVKGRQIGDLNGSLQALSCQTPAAEEGDTESRWAQNVVILPPLRLGKADAETQGDVRVRPLAQEDTMDAECDSSVEVHGESMEGKGTAKNEGRSAERSVGPMKDEPKRLPSLSELSRTLGVEDIFARASQSSRNVGPP